MSEAHELRIRTSDERAGKDLTTKNERTNEMMWMSDTVLTASGFFLPHNTLPCRTQPLDGRAFHLAFNGHWDGVHIPRLRASPWWDWCFTEVSFIISI